MLEYLEQLKVEDYNKLRKAVGWGELPIKQAQIGLEHSNYIIACYLDGNVVGSARMLWDGGYVAYIADIMVLPEQQGRGIGKQLMERIMNYLYTNLEEGWTIMVVLVAAKGKEAFYKKFGFIERPNDVYGAGMSQRIKMDDVVHRK